MSKCVYHKGGSKKYVLDKHFSEKIEVKPNKDIFLSYCTLLKTGLLFIPPGYEWDGPSGPTFDTDDFMDGSLVHDVLYQLLREGHLMPWSQYRFYADNELIRQCRKDGMPWWRCAYVWLGVRLGGGPSAM
jgi:hypothetical protein